MGGANTAIRGTHLSPEQEKAFQQWKSVNRPGDSGQDYDLRGAYLAELKPDGRGHLDDLFKFDNHPTFSTMSKYSTASKPGGEWGVAPDRQHTTYEPSKWMEEDKPRMEFLAQYMKEKEPNTILVRRATQE